MKTMCGLDTISKCGFHLQSWTKLLGQIYIVALFQTRQTVTLEFIYTWSAPPPPSPPTYNVGHLYTLFLQSFNIAWGGGGVK